MLSTWLPLPRSTALHPPQKLAQAFPISPSPKSSQLMFWKSCKTWTRINQLGLTIWTLYFWNYPPPLSQPLLPTYLSYRLRSPRIGKLPQSSPSSKGETPWTQTVTDLYPSCPAYLRSSKAKSTNRSLTISNPTVPSPLCNLVSEPVTGAPQPHSRY